MSRRTYRLFLTLFLLVVFPPAAVRSAVAQGRTMPAAPGEAALVNWTNVDVPEFSLGAPPFQKLPFRSYSLESVEGSKRWVKRSYHWDAYGELVVDSTEVYPNGSLMVYSVIGYSQTLGGFGGSGVWGGYPTLTFGVLIPIASSGPIRVAPGALHVGPDRAAINRVPVAQAMGYQRLAAPRLASAAPQAACPASAPYAPNGPPLEASCVLFESGQSLNLSNQTRVVRVGSDYRVMVGQSTVNNFTNVIIVRIANQYYALETVGTNY